MLKLRRNDVYKQVMGMHKESMLEAIQSDDYDRLQTVMESIDNKTNAIYDWLVYREEGRKKDDISGDC